VGQGGIELQGYPHGRPAMNILYHFRTRGTGAEAVHIAGIVRAFEGMGHGVILSSPTGADPRRTAGTSPFAEPGTSTRGWLGRLIFEALEIGYNIPAFFRNLGLVRRHGCGMIYERHAFFLFSTALVAGLMGRPLVVEVNELIGDPRVREQPVFAGLARWSDRFVFKRARLIVTVSPHLRRRVLEYGITEERVVVAPNAISARELEAPARTISFGLPASNFLLGFVGWLVEWHRLDFVIDALAAPEFARVVLVVIGEGPLRGRLEEQARERGVRIHFHGPLPHADIPAALRAMDACVVPHSNAYRSPIKLFEFMAQERPILAPRTEPIETVVRDGEEALLFAPLEVESFRRALLKLLNSKALCDSLGRAARRAVEEKHTWEGNAVRIMASID